MLLIFHPKVATSRQPYWIPLSFPFIPVSSATCQTLTSVDIEAPPPYDIETLPSYTIASGLPSYEDAIRHIVRQQQQSRTSGGYQPATSVQKPRTACSNNHNAVSIHPQTVVKFFESRPENWLNVTVFEEIHYNFVGRGTSVADPAGMSAEGHTNKAEEAISDGSSQDESSKSTASDGSNGLFRVQICMVDENEKNQSCNRWEDERYEIHPRGQPTDSKINCVIYGLVSCLSSEKEDCVRVYFFVHNSWLEERDRGTQMYFIYLERIIDWCAQQENKFWKYDQFLPWSVRVYLIPMYYGARLRK